VLDLIEIPTDNLDLSISALTIQKRVREFPRPMEFIQFTVSVGASADRVVAQIGRSRSLHFAYCVSKESDRLVRP
jgi:hypothetical protein